MDSSPSPRVVLASTSPYRKKLLEDIGLHPVCLTPKADEATVSEENHSPREVAEERAFLKVRSISAQHPNDIVIGGDQLAHLEGKILGKPKTRENAFAQLKSMSGKTHQLITSLVVAYRGREYLHTDITSLRMRELSDENLKAYIALDDPLDCAGSYKIEKHGLWLFSRIESDDHTAIQGIPLLALVDQLSRLLGDFPVTALR